MTFLCLANRDYGPATDGWGAHTSSEGMELQLGLEHAGWILAGVGYGDGCSDVRELLERFKPTMVFVSDPRDWDPNHQGSFRKDVGFVNIDELAKRPDIFRATVVKDAGSVRDYQRQFFQRIHGDAAVVYYHPEIVRSLNPWLQNVPLIRTWHSVDPDACRRSDLSRSRKRAVVTGATSRAYPLRTQIMLRALDDPSLGVDVFGHPGYHNRGSHTPFYLAMLAGYRVHVATASRFGFALRKLVESVAVGATPVTNLPASDTLPEIDGALVRVSQEATVREVLDAVERAARAWDLEERIGWAEKAWAWYDWRVMGERLSRAIEERRGSSNVADRS